MDEGAVGGGYGGAKPKTPTKTPTKKSENLDLSPASKARICVLCSNAEPKPQYRYRLFKNEKMSDKTEACNRVEAALDISVQSLMYGDIICRLCDKTLKKIIKADTESAKLKVDMVENYVKAVENLKKKFGRTSSKRLLYCDAPEKDNKRLTSFDGNKENKPQVSKKTQAVNLEKESPSNVWVSQ